MATYYKANDASAYVLGHFHPVYAGETYNGRYTVYGMLGFGASSTV
jgi:hypothetical protein